MRLCDGFRALFRDRRGGVMIFGALALPVAIGAVALVGEYGYALINRVENQRVADMAAYAGAVAYADKKTEAAMVSAAIALAVLNGLPATHLSVALVNSPKTTGSKAVSVTVSTERPLLLARIIGTRTKVDVVSDALAEIGAAAATPGCVLALSQTETGITLTGGTALNATNCAVSSNAAVSVPCGTSITTIGLNYYSNAVPTQPCTGIKTPTGAAVVPVKVVTTDPLAANAAVSGAWSRVSTVSSMSAVTMATVTTGTNIDFAWDQNGTKAQAVALGCVATWVQPKWTLTCNNKTTINVGNVTIGGGIDVDWNLAPTGVTPAQVTYNFSGSIRNTGSKMQFPVGIYNIAKGITTGGGTTTTFGAGTYRIGQSDTACSGSAQFSICNTSTLTFAGPSTFELKAGFSNSGGSTLTLGSGTLNSFKIGRGNTSDAIVLGGGSKTTMGDATGNLSVFQIVGNVNGGGGGSCFVVSAATQHDIAGNFLGSGAIFLGAGTYTVDGYFALGANGGGSASCNGSTISVKGVDVSLVISAKQTPSSGSCSGYAFCVAAGYSGIVLTAPTSGTMAKLAVIGPITTTVKSGALFSEGGSGGAISGAFYFPNGPLVMSGGAGVSGGSSCFQIIASRISLSGGTSFASECISAPATGSGKVSLVQ